MFHTPAKEDVPMVFQVRSLGLQGVSGYEVSAECDLSSGLPEKVKYKLQNIKKNF